MPRRVRLTPAPRRLGIAEPRTRRHHFASIARIVSGGQTGADRAALDFALRHGIPYGGWCPRGGWAEDHHEPPGVLARYPGLTPTDSPDPAVRTVRNVRDSDATLVLVPGGARSAGTALAVRTAARLGRPHLVVDVAGPEAARTVAVFVSGLPPRSTLNIAGPREREAPGCHRLVGSVLDAAHATG